MTSAASNIRLLIVDDHPIVRYGLGALLSVQEDITLVGAVASSDEALAVLDSRAVDIALVDLRMSGGSGIDAIKQIRAAHSNVRCIVLSSFEFDEEIYAAVKAGAQGYLHKESSPEDIMSAIRTVFGGAQSFPRRITERLANQRMTAGLSGREREVLELVAKGLTNKEVASTLRISQFTVRNHLNHITEKLDVTDRTEAIFVALQTGLITLS
jgi:DNA-binding NarL/FixJ family response regulator